MRVISKEMHTLATLRK